MFWQGCELQVTLDVGIAIRTSAPVSLRLNGQLIYVAEESVFCWGIYFALQWDHYASGGGMKLQGFFDLDGVITDTASAFPGWQQIAAEWHQH